jgi:hypothetical protein
VRSHSRASRTTIAAYPDTKNIAFSFCPRRKSVVQAKATIAAMIATLETDLIRLLK